MGDPDRIDGKLINQTNLNKVYRRKTLMANLGVQRPTMMFFGETLLEREANLLLFWYHFADWEKEKYQREMKQWRKTREQEKLLEKPMPGEKPTNQLKINFSLVPIKKFQRRTIQKCARSLLSQM